MRLSTILKPLKCGVTANANRSHEHFGLAIPSTIVD
jgi:hypothetical protein